MYILQSADAYLSELVIITRRQINKLSSGTFFIKTASGGNWKVIFVSTVERPLFNDDTIFEQQQLSDKKNLEASKAAAAAVAATKGKAKTVASAATPLRRTQLCTLGFQIPNVVVSKTIFK
jgi:hypothetical protein